MYIDDDGNLTVRVVVLRNTHIKKYLSFKIRFSRSSAKNYSPPIEA